MTDQKLSLKVVERIDDRGDIIRLVLQDAEGKPLPSFEAGAHLAIEVRDGETVFHRQYSLCGSPSETGCYRLGILKDAASRGGSAAIHRQARPGAVFVADAPANLFPLAEGARRSILFGGGIGITPMIAMAHALEARGGEYEIHYCTRSKSVTAFADVIETAAFAGRVHFHHDDDGTALSPEEFPAYEAGTHLYVCGPEGFMDWIIGLAAKAGFPADSIHREYFTVDVDVSGESFEVEARASGVTVTVGPDDTIAKALKSAGVDVEVKCEEGICGTCITEILEGEADHRDKFLTDEEKAENFEMALCCSRAKGKKLVLDI
ncbi:PDR/VanB family oxidoreductase [Martelella radicis]|uniref:Vanillate O-demethylase ferredoxin subunit n=1 Tax=Martelella radicis TaxID=1397476 RepID=A0A7W6KJM5_9HYPH|nr:PDR/VanB family oxidoreductase [Martelella radicis]MBB4122476.1 vanillate O-demethylase ferredoxin subunit [Martelella radicis]